MGLLNASLANDILPGETGGVAGGEIDVAQVIDELLPSLHSDSRANLIWWTDNELLQWADESLKRLSRLAMVFVGRAGAALTVPGTAAHAVPERHVSTLHVSYDGDPLRPSTQTELEALDSAYRTRAGTPTRWYQELLGMASTGLYPVPDAEEAIGTVYEGFPVEVNASQTLVAAPGPLRGYLAMAILAEAYGREGQAEAPDIAVHCRGRLELYHSIFQAYFGVGM